MISWNAYSLIHLKGLFSCRFIEGVDGVAEIQKIMNKMESHCFTTAFPNLMVVTPKGVPKCFRGGGCHESPPMQSLLNNFFLDLLERDIQVSVHVYYEKQPLCRGERSLCLLRRDDFTPLKMPFYPNMGWVGRGLLGCY